MVIDTYFPIREKEDCIGAIALWEIHPTMKIGIWQVYKIQIVSDKTILFRKNNKEFCITGETYEHEMGTITLRRINGFLNIRVKVNDTVK